MAILNDFNEQYRWYNEKRIKYLEDTGNACLSEMESKIYGKAKYLLQLHRSNVGSDILSVNTVREFTLLEAGQPVLAEGIDNEELHNRRNTYSADSDYSGSSLEKYHDMGELTFYYK